MKRSTVLRLAGVLLLFGAIFSGFGPTPPAQATIACTDCRIGGLCRPCEDGGAQPCQTRVCCGVTTITVCGNCVLHCVPPP
ncbi:MAG TPA: hypothetical protein VLV54_11845 [Thermoanaerobaculia bacterium]|nr:hypothetical protein [Thermoanaerobaculia bacterium]